MMKKNVLVLKHVAFEGPAAIADWLSQQSMAVQELQCNKVADWSALALPDWLVIMGGPMSANDDGLHPWLAQEVAFIQSAIAAGKKVLGVCLGAQLIARALGAAVRSNGQREIGWFPVQATPQGLAHPLGKLFANSPTVLHWHGDTFEIPAGALHLAQSQACQNQAFVYGSHVLALQCHLEMGAAHAEELAQACADELQAGGAFVQSAAEIVREPARFAASQALLARILDQFKDLGAAA